MEDVLPKLDVLYMTRVQKERFFNEDDYIRMKDFPRAAYFKQVQYGVYARMALILTLLNIKVD